MVYFRRRAVTLRSWHRVHHRFHLAALPESCGRAGTRRPASVGFGSRSFCGIWVSLSRPIRSLALRSTAHTRSWVRAWAPRLPDSEELWAVARDVFSPMPTTSVRSNGSQGSQYLSQAHRTAEAAIPRSPHCNLRGQNPEGCKAGRSTHGATDQGRVGDQPHDRQGAGSHRPANASRSRRRSDRMRRRSPSLG
jgi:hypothetical protein